MWSSPRPASPSPHLDAHEMLLVPDVLVLLCSTDYHEDLSVILAMTNAKAPTLATTKEIKGTESRCFWRSSGY